MEQTLNATRISHAEASWLPTPPHIKGTKALARQLVTIAPARGDDVLGRDFLTSKERAILSALELRINATRNIVDTNGPFARRQAQRAATSRAVELVRAGKNADDELAELSLMEHREAAARAALYLLKADLDATLAPILTRAEKAIAERRTNIEKGILDGARKLGFDIPHDHDRVLAIGCLHGCILRALKTGAPVGSRPSDLLTLLGLTLEKNS